VSRAWLVGACSGLSLAIGLGFMLARSRLKYAWIALPVILLAAAVSVPTTVILLVLQSSILGFVLVIVAAVTQRLVERRKLRPAGFVEPSGLLVGGSSGMGRDEVGSEASTVIRARTGTTADHAPAVVAEGLEAR
jgi:hypothetical protein